MGVMGSAYKRVSSAEMYGWVKENPLIFPLEHVVSGRRSPGTGGSAGDRKSLDEGAHYGGERWEEVRVAEYQVPGTEYGVTHIGLQST